MRTPFRFIKESLMTSFWFVPACMAVTGVALAFFTTYIERQYAFADIELISWIYNIGHQGARNLLQLVASSAITVTSVIFSIAILSVTMASGQFGPRLIRNFMKAGGSQLAMGTFIAAFMYCLIVLVHIPHDEVDDANLPYLSVFGSLIWGAVSFAVLISFVHHVAVFMQAPRIISDVQKDLVKSLRDNFPKRKAAADSAAHEAERHLREIFANENSQPCFVESSGYLLSVDTEALLNLAQREQLCFKLNVRPGAFIHRQQPVARVIGLPVSPELSRASMSSYRLMKEFNQSFVVGAQRTAVQDPVFALNQMVEVAIRALSTGINDPFTAITCLNCITEGLCELAELELPPSYLQKDGAIWVLLDGYDYDGLIAAAFNQIRQNARDNPAVIIQLVNCIEVLGELGMPDACTAPLKQQLLKVEEASIPHMPTRADTADLRGALDKAWRALANGENNGDGNRLSAVG